MSSRRSRLGFTLIEMLVVIAIIAVLAGILFPVFSRARAKTRRTACLSNMRQVCVALQLYAADNKGFTPSFSQSHPDWSSPPATPNVPDPTVITWDLSIQKNLKNKEVLVCPDNPFGRTPQRRAYALTAYTQRKIGALTYLGGDLERIPVPSKTVLLFEKGANEPGCWGDAMGENFAQSHESLGQQGYSDAFFHSKGKNFGFADGHSRWYVGTSGPFIEPTANNPGDCHIAATIANGGDWPDAD